MKPNTRIIIGISLPIVVVLIVVISAVVPSLSFKSQYNFIYATGGVCGSTTRSTAYCSDYTYYRSPNWYPYKVENGRIVKEATFPLISVYDTTLKEDVTKPLVVTTYPTLYLYDTKNDTFTALSLEEAQKFTVTNGGSAPDGTILVNSQYGSQGLIGELLGGSSARGYFLKKGSSRKKIELKNADGNDYYGDRNTQLLGWVISK